MEAADDCVDFVDAGGFLGLAHRVDDAGVAARRDHDEAAGVDGHVWLELSLSRRGERWQGAVVVEVAAAEDQRVRARFPPWS